jgi:peptidoglycan/LPS O-acetylase OafA/YrhL
MRGFGSNVALIGLLCASQLVFCYLLVDNQESILQWYQSIFGLVVRDKDPFTGLTITGISSAYNFFQWLQTYSPLTRLWQFLLGAAVANAYLLQRRSISSFRLAPLAALLFMLGFSALNSFFFYPWESTLFGRFALFRSTFSTVIFSFFCAAIIYSATVNRNAPTSRFLGSRWMTKAGDATYASYLLHVALLDYVDRNIASLTIAGVAWRQAAPRVASLVLTYGFIVLVSYGVFSLFEAPARSWIRRHCTPNNYQRRHRNPVRHVRHGHDLRDVAPVGSARIRRCATLERYARTGGRSCQIL